VIIPNESLHIAYKDLVTKHPSVNADTLTVCPLMLF